MIDILIVALMSFIIFGILSMVGGAFLSNCIGRKPLDSLDRWIPYAVWFPKKINFYEEAVFPNTVFTCTKKWRFFGVIWRKKIGDKWEYRNRPPSYLEQKKLSEETAHNKAIRKGMKPIFTLNELEKAQRFIEGERPWRKDPNS